MENERIARIAGLVREYTNCEKCKKLCANRKKITWASDRLDSKIVVVESHPNEEGEASDTSLGGIERDYLNRILRGSGIDPSWVYVTTTVLCRPQGRQPTVREQRNCFDRLSVEIEVIDPILVVVMGHSAAKIMLNVGSKFASTAKHADAPFMEVSTRGVRGDVKRNAILTFSLKDIREKEGCIPLTKGSHTEWVVKAFKRAKSILDCYAELYG